MKNWNRAIEQEKEDKCMQKRRDCENERDSADRKDEKVLCLEGKRRTCYSHKPELNGIGERDVKGIKRGAK